MRLYHLNKRGDITGELVIFIILNLAVFFFLGFFVSRTSSGAELYEQTYAKQIALFIDGTKPQMEIALNMKEAIDLTKKLRKELKNLEPKEILKNYKLVSLDKDKNLVNVNILGKQGYSFKYFSDYKVDFNFVGEFLYITINEKSSFEKDLGENIT